MKYGSGDSVVNLIGSTWQRKRRFAGRRFHQHHALGLIRRRREFHPIPATARAQDPDGRPPLSVVVTQQLRCGINGRTVSRDGLEHSRPRDRRLNRCPDHARAAAQKKREDETESVGGLEIHWGEKRSRATEMEIPIAGWEGQFPQLTLSQST